MVLKRANVVRQSCVEHGHELSFEEISNISLLQTTQIQNKTEPYTKSNKLQRRLHRHFLQRFHLPFQSACVNRGTRRVNFTQQVSEGRFCVMCSFLKAKKNVSVQERIKLHPLLICSDTQAELSNFRKF